VSLDLAIRGGTVIDGDGGPGYEADVGIEGGRIVEIGRLSEPHAPTVLDASACFVAPGFIDMHSHVEESLLAGESLEPKLRQGVTLEVMGQDGIGLAPAPHGTKELIARTYSTWSGTGSELDWGWSSVGELLDRLDGGETNGVLLVPHGNLRMAAARLEDRDVREGELDEMRRELAHALQQGAAGLSTGLTYLPCMFASTSELIALCEVVAASDGYFSPHHRGYGIGAIECYLECDEICRASGASVHLTHAVLEYDENAGRADEILRIVDRARADGYDMTLDTYPYTAGVSNLASFLPAWAQEGGHDPTMQRLTDDSALNAIRRDMLDGRIPTHTPIDWEVLVLSSVDHPRHREWVGSSLARVGELSGLDPFGCFVDLLIENHLTAQVLEFAADEQNVRALLPHARHMVGSDGTLQGSRPHPRAWGAFARFLGRYVRDLGLLPWEEAIRKITSLPADTVGIRDRGRVAVGNHADIAVFEPGSVIDTATYDHPASLAAGMRHVLVNGEPAIEAERSTARRAGRALRVG